MPSIVVGVETDQITVKHTEQDLVADWENAVDLGARERGVKEEAKLDVLLGITNLLAQHGRE